MILRAVLAVWFLSVLCNSASGRESVAPPTAGNVLLGSLALPQDAETDASLQEALERLDERLREEFGVAVEKRACGVLHLNSGRLAWLRPDAMFYGASVPKICILLGYFEEHPEAATSLDPVVERELQLMIKRSNNELAAKYSQSVGLETIQRLQREKYHLYDAEKGGGLWCGKHYGLATPRTGDPLEDRSHAVTVRQCLRYYLLLEQGRLVSPEASARMKAIFAAPRLAFHDDNFVRGLRGRDVTVLRKNGLWEDWHLDTARVEHGEDVYLIAAAVEHPRGGEYLSGFAAGVDDALCDGQPKASRFAHELVHRVLSDEQVTVKVPPENDCLVYESEVIESNILFNQVLPSWNVEVRHDEGFFVEIRVGRDYDGTWSPYLYVGDWGAFPAPEEKQTRWSHGRVDVDYFRSDELFQRVQIRFSFYSTTELHKVPVRRYALCLSDTTGIPRAPTLPVPVGEPRAFDFAPADAQRRLDVPGRSQRVEDKAIASRICSPTSVAMVVEYRKRRVATAQMAATLYDGEHDIYGNWPRAIQGAFTYGVPGYLDRFADWRRVEEHIARGQPLIISIRSEKGDIAAAPIAYTSGHLLVLTGFEGDDGVHVNDPAADSAEASRRVYRRSELEKVWMRRGGTAYVLLPAQ